MKKLLAIVVFGSFVLGCSLSLGQNGQNNSQKIVPPVIISGWKSEVSGYARGDTSFRRENGVDFDWENVRAMFDVASPNSRLSIHNEFEMLDVNTRNNLWLIEANASLRPANKEDKWSLKIGRVFTAAPLYTAHPLSSLETAHVPREPWALYGYGVQLGESWNGWKFVGDITTADKMTAKGHEDWSHVFLSAKLSKSITDEFTLGTMIQVSHDLARFGAEWNYRPIPRLTFKGEVYGAIEPEQTVYGGYAIGSYQVTKWFIPHVQIDHQNGAIGNKGKDGTIATAGFLVPIGRQVRVVIDYEKHFDNDTRSGGYLGLQAKY